MGRVLGRAFDLLEDSLAIVSGLGLIAIILSITYDVFGRRFFGVSANWALEFAQYYLLFLTFMSAPWILRNHGHVSIGLIHQKLGPRASLRLRTAAYGIATLACLLGLWFTFDIVHLAYTRGMLTGIVFYFPRWIVLSPMPLGLSLLIIEFCRQIYRMQRTGQAVHLSMAEGAE